MGKYHDEFVEQGYVVLENLVPAELLTKLQTAVEKLIRLRDEGKTSSPQRHQTILEPGYFDQSYLDFLNIDKIHEVVNDIFENEEYIITDYAALLGHTKHCLATWHRDIIHQKHDEMTEFYSATSAYAQMNCAVFDDQSLYVVPKSHNRTDTDGERDYVKNYSHIKFMGDVDSADIPEAINAMPGVFNVKLKSGDALLYNNIMWHCAEYRPENKRAIIHPDFVKVSTLENFPIMRGGLKDNPWLMEPEYLGDLGPHYAKLLKTYQREKERWTAEAV